MKQRNLALAFVLLMLFGILGVFYFRTYVVPKPFGLILFVSEGLTSSKVYSTRLYQGGADQFLTIEKLPHLALLSTYGNDLAVSDAASAASALATGKKVNQRALSVDSNGQALQTLLEMAHESGRATGLITNGSLTDPTPAAFYAHDIDYRNRESNATQLLDRKGLIDVLFGFGADYFLPSSKDGGKRTDARDLLIEASQRLQYTVVRTHEELQSSPVWKTPKLFGVFSNREGLNLTDLVQHSIEVLQRNRNGYVLVVDASLVGHASEQNRGEKMLQELAQLDHAVDTAVQYAGNKALVVAAGTVSTGGFALNGYPLRQDRGVALLGISVYGWPSLTWATGPHGYQKIESDLNPLNENDTPQSIEPALFGTPVAANVADEVIATGIGSGSEELQGFKNNTFIFNLFSAQL